ncbi:BrnT family toxin [Patescibacteria group bacterium]|nr:BrnT family toxin [Patescibacteria group bacterium]MBU1472915.1 BrnT family toxin [Patescibacteria group bacterium]MBU2460325.1 BrnT family toxin [Patescibacteria group bacterium]MBU2544062.1 BrnT family toxin [Patescibacteria group bacterium]
MKTDEAIQFEWDEGNREKSKKHGVETKESEEAFFDTKKVIYKDVFHSTKEERFILLGKTKLKLLLYIVFTYRKQSVRIISARNINRKEVHLYEKET